MFGKKKMDRSSLKALRGATWQSVLMGLIFVACGVLLLTNPEGFIRSIFYIMGALFIVTGIIQIVLYLLSGVEKSLQQRRVFTGAVLIIIGIFLNVGYRLILSVIPFVLGLVILFNGVMKLQTAMDAMKMKSPKYGLLLGVAILTVMLGIFISFNPFKTAKTVLRVIGACMIFSGVTDLFNVLYVSRGLRNYLKDMEALTQDPKD